MTENKIRENRSDVAALMLAAADDPEAVPVAIMQLSYGEAAEMLMSAVIIGGQLVRQGDEHPEFTPRETLGAVLAACRSDVQE